VRNDIALLTTASQARQRSTAGSWILAPLLELLELLVLLELLRFLDDRLAPTDL
jgi:hypothetical protein